MLCAKCNSQISDPDARFCQKCGASLPAAADPVLEVDGAGFWRRVGAYVIDDLIGMVFCGMSWFAVMILWEVLLEGKVGTGIFGDDDALVSFFGSVGGLVLWWLYYAFMESSSLQGTLGKLAFGMAVTDSKLGRISFGRATGRFFAKFISAIILGMGFVMAGVTEKKQALHDVIAGCFVVKKRSLP